MSQKPSIIGGRAEFTRMLRRQMQCQSGDELRSGITKHLFAGLDVRLIDVLRRANLTRVKISCRLGSTSFE